MKTVSGKEFIHDAVDPFEGRCPSCGEKITFKKIKKGNTRGIHRRGLRSFECIPCGYAEYDSNQREELITKGVFDNEL
jgi:Zn ribbon nucleic-acid-binding protein